MEGKSVEKVKLEVLHNHKSICEDYSELILTGFLKPTLTNSFRRILSLISPSVKTDLT